MTKLDVTALPTLALGTDYIVEEMSNSSKCGLDLHALHNSFIPFPIPIT